MAVLLLLAAAGWPQGMLRLKTRTVTPSAASGPSSPLSAPAGVRQHFLILFGSYPGPDVVAELETRRVVVLAYVPENGLMVSASRLNLRGMDVLWAGRMDPQDKISPIVSNQPQGSYLVIWHPDTDVARDAELAGNLGFTVVPNGHLLPGQLLVSGAYSGLRSLAALDAVAYILPASTELLTGDAIAGCAGPSTAFGPAPQYVQANGGWRKDAAGKVSIGYYFESLTPKVPESQVRAEIARALTAWTQYTNITITPASQPGQGRSIDVLFARYGHGDAYPFTGPGGVIAHTFYPAPSNPEPLAGDMHLNADERWQVGGTVDLFSVALHEAGHALGLGHSDDPSSVMYPYYRLQTGLTADDIAGIQAIYGKPASGKPASGAPASGAPGSGAPGSVGTAGGSTVSTGSAGGTSAGSPPVTGTGTSAGSDTVSPTVSIVSPGLSMVSTSSATISVSGKAGDNVGVASVQWSTSTGGSGMANGTTAWLAVVPLLVGNNTVTVRAYDAAGNSAWRAITVVRNQ